VLLSCGHWDHGLRVVAVDDGRELQIATGHRDLVTCLATTVPGGATGGRAWAANNSRGSGGGGGVGGGGTGGGAFSGVELGDSGWTDGAAIVVSGSRDTTVAVWEVTPPPGGWGGPTSKISFARGGGLGQQPRRILFGHNDAVTCVAASAELDLVASGGADGAVLLHTLRAGRHLRTILPSNATSSSNSGNGGVGGPHGGGRAVCGSGDGGASSMHGTGTSGTPSWVSLVEAITARVLVYCSDQLTLSSHGINALGHAPALAWAHTTERLHALVVTRDGRFLVTAGRGDTPPSIQPLSKASRASRITHHASRITHHTSRITHHASRITPLPWWSHEPVSVAAISTSGEALTPRGGRSSDPRSMSGV
jgi:WD40 repeat protein